MKTRKIPDNDELSVADIFAMKQKLQNLLIAAVFSYLIDLLNHGNLTYQIKILVFIVGLLGTNIISFICSWLVYWLQVQRKENIDVFADVTYDSNKKPAFYTLSVFTTCYTDNTWKINRDVRRYDLKYCEICQYERTTEHVRPNERKTTISVPDTREVTVDRTAIIEFTHEKKYIAQITHNEGVGTWTCKGTKLGKKDKEAFLHIYKSESPLSKAQVRRFCMLAL